MTTPTVSVIIPTFNRPRELDRAINSVLSQSLQDLELIVVDDSGTGSARPVIETFDDARVRYVAHSENLGQAASRNTGIRSARSPLLAFCDDDDFLTEDFLELMFTRISTASQNIAYVVPSVLEIDLRTREPRIRVASPQLFEPSIDGGLVSGFLSRTPFSGWFPMVKREVFASVGLFDERLRTEEARDLLNRIAASWGYEVAPEALAVHIFHKGEHMNVYGPKKLAALEQIFKTNEGFLNKNRKLSSLWNYKLGWIAMRCGEVSVGHSFLRAALDEGLGGSKRFIARAYLVAPRSTTRLHHLLGQLKRSRKFSKVRLLEGSDTFQGFDVQHLQTLISLACAIKA